MSPLEATVDEFIEAAARRPFLDGGRVRRLWRRYRAGHAIVWRKLENVVSLEAILQAHKM